MTIIDAISSDLDWRESEIASLKILLSRSDLGPIQKQTLLRAAWAMLYAHYEGYVKFCFTIFFEEIEKRSIRCSDLPSSTQSFALRSAIKEIRTLPLEDCIIKILSFKEDFIEAAAKFPEIETNANLWPDLLVKFMNLADLDPAVVLYHKRKLDTLVARRNGIAHGEQDIIKETEYYFGFEAAVYEVFYDLAFQLEHKICQAPYSKKNL